MMTWDDLAAMDPDVVSVGAHTMTHPVLTRLEPADAAREIRESGRQLEGRLTRLVEHFCYPFGAWNPAVAGHARPCYAAAVTSDAGRVRAGDDLYGLPRVSATPRLSLLAWRLHRPTA